MPVKSRFPDVEIPDVDIFSFVFKSKKMAWPDSHGVFGQI